jgi:hypothetical protein
MAASGKPARKPFKGDLADLSAGGLSLCIRTSKKDTPPLLLGRNIQGRFRVSSAEDAGSVQIQGTIIGVHYHQQNDYSLHVKFHKPLEENIVRQAARTAAPS